MRRSAVWMWAGAIFALAQVATLGQIVEIPAMTMPHAVIDMDNVGPVGTTTVAAINAAGMPTPASLTGINLTPSTAAAGVYNTNPQGRALALDGAGNLILIDPPSGAFVAFNAKIDLGCQSTEFGCSIGDWAGTMVLTCFLAGNSIGSVSPNYTSGGIHYIQSTAGPFDRVDIACSSTGGNWVIPDLIVECSGPGVILSQPTPGSLQIDNAGLMVGAETWNAFTFNSQCAGGPGSGGLLGLCANNAAAIQALVLQVTSPLSAGNLFHFPAFTTATTWGPYAGIGSGITLEAVCFYLDTSGGGVVAGSVSHLTTQ